MAKIKDGAMGPVAGLTPHIVVHGAKEAIKFYKKALGAKTHVTLPADDGKRLIHAHLEINGASLMLCDDFPEHGGGKPTPAPAAVTLHLQVDDTDKWFKRAVKAGASAAMPPEDMFWGDRYAQVKDPYGHMWAFGGPIKKKAAAKKTAPAKKKAKR